MQHTNIFDNNGNGWDAGSSFDVYGAIGQANGFDPDALPPKVVVPVAVEIAPEIEPEVIPAAPALVVGPQAQIYIGRVRSGSRVVNETGDLVIMGDVNPGAELVAAGHIHVYGAMGGRAFAGMGGHTDALVFCQRFQAEIISIAGNYRSFETVPDDLNDKAVCFNLEDNQLRFAPLR